MVNLILNENMKIYKKIGTWVMIAILLLIVIISAVVIKSNENNMAQRTEKSEFNGTEEEYDWKKELQYNIQMMKEDQKIFGDKLDPYTKNYYEEMIHIYQYQIDHNLEPKQETTAWTFAEMMQEAILVITLFTVIVGAGILASEFTWGTIKLLLIRPVSRTKILLSKLIATFLFAFTLVLLLFASSILIGSVLFGFSDGNVHLYYDGKTVIEQSMFTYIWYLYGLHMVGLVSIVLFAFAISTLFKSSAMAIGVSIFLMLSGEVLVLTLSRFEWVKYLFFANTDLTMYLTGQPIIEGMTMSFSFLMNGLYSLCFLFISWLVFTKKDIVS